MLPKLVFEARSRKTGTRRRSCWPMSRAWRRGRSSRSCVGGARHLADGEPVWLRMITGTETPDSGKVVPAWISSAPSLVRSEWPVDHAALVVEVHLETVPGHGEQVRRTVLVRIKPGRDPRADVLRAVGEPAYLRLLGPSLQAGEPQQVVEGGHEARGRSDRVEARRRTR